MLIVNLNVDLASIFHIFLFCFLIKSDWISDKLSGVCVMSSQSFIWQIIILPSKSGDIKQSSATAWSGLAWLWSIDCKGKGWFIKEYKYNFQTVIRWERKNSTLSLLFTFSQAGKLLSFSFVRLFLLWRLFLCSSTSILTLSRKTSQNQQTVIRFCPRNNSNGKSKSFPNLDFLTLPCSTVLFTPVKVEHGGHRRYNETEPSELLFPGISVAILDHECLLCCLTFMTWLGYIIESRACW